MTGNGEQWLEKGGYRQIWTQACRPADQEKGKEGERKRGRGKVKREKESVGQQGVAVTYYLQELALALQDQHWQHGLGLGMDSPETGQWDSHGLKQAPLELYKYCMYVPT